MLDNITKKRIDDCRDVLVGKVPDPKSQIEQITLALIYKFMDDMDKESVEKFKGKAKFFTGEFAKYGWRKLFDPSLGGKEMLDLYSQALDKLQTNANIPELFRNIFKNAFLPYKDPATLKMFLKLIDEFEYSHSEKLGDAFEYLLSVMGSQGDAGQFRTPRHVIDFITACVNPQKNETVADPACGTAGFLLSAYKHILNQNTDKRLGDKLTPDQRRKLSENFMGYDISPDMVRLSLVNMYLHGFTTPQIFEYDTLSSEERWDETFDVILANPPFMTPKGGIRPHKKFGVQANKAEVLFTDYIAEHLNKNGRAGIVVPNGIISTTQSAYIQLRRLLADHSLIAVISLPAGCFNPYSPVKTSVLLLDKSLAKKSSSILFIKVSNDGYDLGAQRREIEKNDLPMALDAFNAFKKHLSEGNPFNVQNYNDLCSLVEKERILNNEDVLLNGDRYLARTELNTEFEKVKLGDILEYEQPSKYIVDSENYDNSYKTPVLTAGKSFILGYTNEIKGIFSEDLPVIIFDDFTTATKFVDFPFKVKSSAMKILKSNKEVSNIKYLYHVMQKIEFDASEHKRYWISQYSEIQIPLPPLEVQNEIVREIEGYQKIIDGAKMVVDNYKPTIKIKSEWEIVELGEICKIQSGGTPSRSVIKYWENGTIPWVGSGVCKNQIIDSDVVGEFITQEGFENSNTKLFSKGTTLIALVGATIGKTAFLNFESTTNQNIAGLQTIDELKLDSKFLYYASRNLYPEFYKLGEGGFSMASLAFVKKLSIPLPTIEEQILIVSKIEQEQKIINANKQLISIFEQRIKDKINEVWGVKDGIEK